MCNIKSYRNPFSYARSIKKVLAGTLNCFDKNSENRQKQKLLRGFSFLCSNTVTLYNNF
jgi:hypothetical protein